MPGRFEARIPEELDDEIMEQYEALQSGRDVADWLKETHGLKVSHAAVLRRVRRLERVEARRVLAACHQELIQNRVLRAFERMTLVEKMRVDLMIKLANGTASTQLIAAAPQLTRLMRDQDRVSEFNLKGSGLFEYAKTAAKECGHVDETEDWAPEAVQDRTVTDESNGQGRPLPLHDALPDMDRQEAEAGTSEGSGQELPAVAPEFPVEEATPVSVATGTPARCEPEPAPGPVQDRTTPVSAPWNRPLTGGTSEPMRASAG